MLDRRTSQPAQQRQFFSAAISRFRPLIGGGLAALVFAQTAFGYQPQISMWADRHLSVSPAVLSLAPSHALLPDVFHSLKKPIQDPSALPLPGGFLRSVNVKSVRKGTIPGVIVLLEDVHHNDEAQANISIALRALSDEPGASPVPIALEGAAGAFLFGTYQHFPARIGDAVANAFLKTGEISGPAHAGFVSRSSKVHRGLQFMGAEDASLYRRNVEAYRAAAPLRSHAEAALLRSETALALRKASVFSGELTAFDQSAAQYRAGALSMGAYAGVLEKISPEMPASVRNFLEAWRTEQQLDFTRVEAERRQVLESLVAKLSAHQIEALLRLSLGYRQGTVFFGRYYAELKLICEAAGVNLTKTPFFADYLHYVLLADDIDADALFSGLDEMEDRAYDRLASSELERGLVRESRRLRLLHGLTGFSMTSHDWKRYAASGTGTSGAMLRPFEDFYRLAEERSASLASAAVTPADLSVLVAGGYHTAEILPLLSATGRTVIVCSPRLTKADLTTASSYLSLFEREKAPLDRLFSGKQIFLATPPAGAATSLVDSQNPLPVMAHLSLVLSMAWDGTRRRWTEYRKAASALGDAVRVTGIRRSGSSVEVDSAKGDQQVRTVVGDETSNTGTGWTEMDQRVVDGTTVTTLVRDARPKYARYLVYALGVLMLAGIPLVLGVFELKMRSVTAVLPGLSACGVLLPPMIIIFLVFVMTVNMTSGASSGSGTSTDGRVHLLRALSTDGKGVEPWLEGLRKATIVEPGRNVVEIAAEISANEGKSHPVHLYPVLTSPLLKTVAEYGAKGVNVTAAAVIADLRSGAYDAEVETLISRGVTDPKEIVRHLLRSLAVVANAVLAMDGGSSKRLRVSQETDMALAVTEGEKDGVMADVARVSEGNHQIGARMPTWVFGRNGTERRGAVDNLYYESALNGTIPQINNNFGAQSYLLTVKGFLYGLHQRIHNIFEDSITNGVQDHDARKIAQEEVARLSTSIGGVSVDELDRHPVFGFNALIDLGIQLKEADLARLTAIDSVDPAGTLALTKELEELRALKGKGGLAMMKVISEIHGYIFFGKPLHEHEIERLFGAFMLPDINDARGIVQRITRDTGVVPFQRIMIGARGMNGGDPVIRTAGFAGGWEPGTAPRSAAYTPDEMSQMGSFLLATGLPKREFSAESIPADALSENELAAAMIGGPSRRKEPLAVLAELNDLVRFLQSRSALPSQVVATAKDHNRTISINDVSESVNEATAMELARVRKEAEAEAQQAVLRVSQTPGTRQTNLTGRKIFNRLFLISTFITPLLLVTAASLFVNRGTALWAVAIVWAIGGIPFLIQAIHMAAAVYGVRPWTGLILRALDFPRRDERGYAGFSHGGMVYLNWWIMGRLTPAQQRSVIAEEERHFRYQVQRLYVITDLFEPRSILQLAWEEWYVNVVMPLVDAFNAHHGIHPVSPFRQAGLDVSEAYANLLHPSARNSNHPFGPTSYGGFGMMVPAIGSGNGVSWVGFAVAVAAAAVILYRLVKRSGRVDETARRWAEEGAQLSRGVTEHKRVVDALMMAAPAKKIFERDDERSLRVKSVQGFMAAAPAGAVLNQIHFSGFAAYRESVAARTVSVPEAVNAAIRSQADGIVVFHLNQLGDPAVLAEELKELEAAVLQAEAKRAEGQRVAIVAAVSGEIPADVLDRVHSLMKRGGAVVAVGENLRTKDGAAYSYEELLRQALLASPELDSIRAILDGQYDNASFVTFSKIPTQFLADGRLREIWTLLANIGAGWTPISVDTMMRTLVLVERNA